MCHAALCKQKLVSYSEVYVLGNHCPQKEKIIGAFGALTISVQAKLVCISVMRVGSDTFGDPIFLKGLQN